MLPCASGSCLLSRVEPSYWDPLVWAVVFQERKLQMVLNLSCPGFIEICPLSPIFRALSYILAKGAPCPGGVVGGGVGCVSGATAVTD